MSKTTRVRTHRRRKPGGGSTIVRAYYRKRVSGGGHTFPPHRNRAEGDDDLVVIKNRYPELYDYLRACHGDIENDDEEREKARMTVARWKQEEGGDLERSYKSFKTWLEASALPKAGRATTGGKREPWELSRDEFNRTFKTVRHFQKYTPEQRAERMASFRGGHRQREALGEYFYTHELEERSIAYPSPKEAKENVRRRLVEHALETGNRVPLSVLQDYPDLMSKYTRQPKTTIRR